MRDQFRFFVKWMGSKDHAATHPIGFRDGPDANQNDSAIYRPLRGSAWRQANADDPDAYVLCVHVWLSGSAARSASRPGATTHFLALACMARSRVSAWIVSNWLGNGHGHVGLRKFTV